MQLAQMHPRETSGESIPPSRDPRSGVPQEDDAEEAGSDLGEVFHVADSGVLSRDSSEEGAPVEESLTGGPVVPESDVAKTKPASDAAGGDGVASGVACGAGEESKEATGASHGQLGSEPVEVAQPPSHPFGTEGEGARSSGEHQVESQDTSGTVTDLSSPSCHETALSIGVTDCATCADGDDGTAKIDKASKVQEPLPTEASKLGKPHKTPPVEESIPIIHGTNATDTEKHSKEKCKMTDSAISYTEVQNALDFVKYARDLEIERR